jgi:hypothetical protein
MLLRCCLQLFHSLKSHAPGDSEWDDLVAFLQEFCSLAKHLQMQHRQNLWNKMTQLGMFEVSRATVMAVVHGLAAWWAGASSVCRLESSVEWALVKVQS